jgi:hypothetical protein
MQWGTEFRRVLRTDSAECVAISYDLRMYGFTEVKRL